MKGSTKLKPHAKQLPVFFSLFGAVTAVSRHRRGLLAPLIIFCAGISASFAGTLTSTADSLAAPLKNTGLFQGPSHPSVPVERANALLDKAAQQVLFMENRGQVLDQRGRARPDVLFLAKSGGMKVALRANGISYQFEKANVKEAAKREKKSLPQDPGLAVREVESVETHRLDMYLEGANPAPEVLRETEGGYTENYYNISSTPEGITGVKSWTRIRMKEVYPGIDWVIYSKEGKMKYDFIVRPGADPARIRMRYAGGADLHIGRDGALTVKTPLGEISEQAPVSYQDGREIPSRFVLKGAVLSLAFTGHDPSRTLVVDPALLWATYYGDTEIDYGSSTATDDSGNVYLAGSTNSPTGIASGGHQNTVGITTDAFLVKFNASGIRQWATYYGGAGNDGGQSTATDDSGNVYLAGATTNSGLASGGHQNTIGGGFDAYLVKFNTSGVRLWATYYGGTFSDYGYSAVTDGSGNVYMAGVTNSSSTGIASGGHQNAIGGDWDAFLVKFNSSGVRQWGTYYGGAGNDGGQSTVTDGSGNVYLTGRTSSSTDIASGGHQNAIGGGVDAFLIKFNASGVRQWGTYYGGTGSDYSNSAATDGSGNVYLAGYTDSGMGIASGGHQNTIGGAKDCYLVKFNASGTRQWATYYGGADDDGEGYTVTDGSGDVYLSGYTNSGTGIASGGYQNTIGGGADAYLVKFDASGEREWGTYYGGTGSDYGSSAATDGSGNVYLTGRTSGSTGLASGGHQNTIGGGSDAFLAKFDGSAPCTAPSGLTYGTNPASYCVGTAIAANTPTVSGTAPITYSISPTLPTGLTLNPSTGEITGIPSAAAAAANYTVTATNTCGSTTVAVNITVSANPAGANAGANQTVCGTSATLAATTPGIGTGAWSIVGGAGGNVTTPSSPTSGFTGVAGTTYTLRWTVSNAPCAASTDEVVIALRANPTGTNAGMDQTVCGTSATLAATTPGIGTGAWSIVGGAGGNVATPSSPTSGFTGTAGTTYTLRWTVSNAPCAASTDDVVIAFRANPTGANAGANQSVCGTSATLAATTPGTGTGAWSIVGGAGGTVTTPSSPTSGFTGTAGTIYTLHWTVSNAPCPASTDDVVINLTANPSAANAGPDQTGTVDCDMDHVTLAGNAPVIGTGMWSIQSGTGGGFGDASNRNSNFYGVEGNTYTLRWTVTNGVCPASTDEMTATFPQIASAGPDQTVCSGPGTATMAGTLPNDGIGTWTKVSGPAGGNLATPTSPTTIVTDLTNVGTYLFQWTIDLPICTTTLVYQMRIMVQDCCPPTGTVWYVDAAAAPGGTGSAWDCAFQNPQDAINAASSGHEVWVKAGTYRPTQDPYGNTTPTNARDKTFYLKDGVGVYGGFAGIETARAQRNWATNVTILSGDIGVASNNADNCFHVVLSVVDFSGTVLDGFTVSHGSGLSQGVLPNITVEGRSISRVDGAGMSAVASNFTLSNCIFSNNATGAGGGGLYQHNANSNVSDCSFSNNIGGQGGAVYNSLSTSTFSNCAFSNNEADDDGGGMYIYNNSAIALDHGTFSGNSAGFNGGGVFVFNASATLEACTFSDNTADFSGGGMYNNAAPSLSATDCKFIGNSVVLNGGGVLNRNCSPTFTNCLFSGNLATAYGGGVYNQNSANTLLLNCTVSGNKASTGGGGISNFSSNPTLTNCVVWNNQHGSSNFGESSLYNSAATPVINYSLIQYLSPSGTGNLDGIANAAMSNYPGFVTPLDPVTAPSTAGDFHLTACSPAINKGTNTGAPATDLFGNTRPFGAKVDMGVHEFQGMPTPAVALCQNTTVLLDGAGNATLTASALNNGSTGCTPLAFSASKTAFTCTDLGANTVTLTVTGFNGATATCNATVTVVDQVAPNALCRDFVKTLGTNGMATVTVAEVDNLSNDNCGTVNLVSVTPGSFGCANIGTNTVTLTVNDGHGNTSTCAATVTIADNTAPTALCQNVSVNLGGNAATVTAAQVDNGSSDNCGTANLSLSTTSFACANVGPNAVTLTVNDGHGNSSTCAATVTVSDATNPTALCQNIPVNLNGNGMATVAASQIDNGSSDNCGIAGLALSATAFTCSNIGANPVTLTVTDNNGRTATCAATVTVSDATNPTAACQNVTVNLDGNGNAALSAAQVDGGSSDNCGIATRAVTPNAFTTSNIGPNVATLTVTDNNGRTASCTATVTVTNTNLPNAACQPYTVSLNGGGMATIAAANVDGGSSAVGGIQSMGVLPNSFNCTNLGANPVTLTVTGNNGQTATCNTTVTVQDNTPPTVVCQNITVNLSGNSANITAAQVLDAGTSTDNCGTVAAQSVSQGTFNCSNLGMNTVTLTAHDGHGNTATCTATVTVNDHTPPTALCQNITVNLGAGGMASVSAAQVNNASTDNCGTVNLVGVSPSSNFTCANIGPNTVTLTVDDGHGNSATCAATVTVRDNTAPTALCRDVVLQLDANGNAALTAAQVNNGSSDNCALGTLSVSPNAFTLANLGLNTVTLTVPDANGNSATCTAQVTVENNQLPNAVCQNIVRSLGTNGQVAISAADIDGGSTALGGISGRVATPNLLNCGNIGSNTVTLTVTGNNGQQASCNATVTVNDATAPTALCKNAPVNLDADGNAAVTAAQINNGSTDNCGTVNLSLSTTAFTCANLGANVVTLTVNDGHGNTSTCAATVTVNDPVAPGIGCPGNQTVTGNATCQGTLGSYAALATKSDNCTVPGSINVTQSPVSGGLFTGSQTVTLTATDGSNNTATCAFTVSVTDNTAPTITCPANQTVSANATCQGTVGDYVALATKSDNCSAPNNINVTQSPASGTGIATTTTVTLTATDAANNSGTCVFSVSIRDVTPPTVICPSNQTVTGNATCQGTLGSYAALATKSDNCSAPGSITVTQSPASGGLFTGSQTVTLTATDGSNNTATCAFTVSVTDNTAPTITCPANQTVSANATCQGTVGDYVALATKSDNCSAPGSINVSQTPASGGLFTGSQTVTLTATDASNNSATCAFMVSVTDNTAPTVGCPANQTVTGNATCQGTLGAYAALATKSDNCSAPGSITVTQSPTSGGLFMGSQTVTLTATDGSNNSATCVFTVSVTDNTAPTITCPANQTVSANASCQGTMGDYAALATKSDNCTAPNNINVTQSPVSGTAIASTTTVTLTATDASNNSGTCVFSVSIRDVTPPTVGCPANQTVTANANCQGTLGSYAALATKSDNCSAPGSINVSQTPASGGLFTGSQTVVLTASDFSENTATCVFTVTVTDNTAPTITCPANQTVSANASCAGTVGNYVALATKSDNCTAPNSIGVTQSPVSGTVIAGTTTVTLTATDAAGNSATCVFAVSIRDVTPPTVGCPANQTVSATTNVPCTAVVNGIDATFNDLCASVSVAYALSGATTGGNSGQASGQTFQAGSTTVTYTATDGAGLSSTCAFSVYVNPCQVTFNGVVTWKQDNTSGVKDATVAVTGDRTGSTTTATNGTYSLVLDPGSNFVLTPSKNLNKLNGVNAQDVTRIQQHLSGGLITNPWQLVAADVNGNNTISALDANILQLALLGNPSALDQMPKSWRFVPKTHTMASPPWGFPENIVLTGAAGTVNNLDFWGLKVGDLVSAYANPANSTGQPLALTARDETLTTGQTLTVDVTANALRDLNALQMALRFDPEYLQLSDMQALGGLPLGKDNFGTYQSAEGSIRVVWSDAQSAALRAGAPLFRLQFTVLEGGPALSQVLHLDDETLLGQVFHSDGSASGVSLRFEGVTAVQNPVADGLRAQLLQNLPNPFVHQTTIGFVLPEACEAQLRIVDAGGRVVAERRKQYPAGRNEERFDLQTAPGVLYYELTTPFGVLARKMVVVE